MNNNTKEMLVSVPCCEEGFLDEYRCLEDKEQQLYQHGDCSTEWVSVGRCADGTTNTYSPSYTTSQSTCPLTAAIKIPRYSFVWDTIVAYITFKNSGSSTTITPNVYVCSDSCVLICSNNLSLSTSNESTISCTYTFTKPGRYQFLVEYQACGEKQTYSSDVISVNNNKPLAYTSTNGERFSILMKDYYQVNRCEERSIDFEIQNTGDATKLSIAVEGEASKWIQTQDSVSLDKGETKTITAKVFVPCDVKEGSYEFSIRARGSTKEASSSSVLSVTRIVKVGIVIDPRIVITLLLLVAIAMLFILLYNINDIRGRMKCFGGC